MATFRTLRGKLLALYVPLVTLSAIAVFAIIEVQYYDSKRGELLQTLDRLLLVEGTTIADAVWNYDEAQIKELFQGIERHLPYIQSAVVEDNAGDVLGVIGDPDMPPEVSDFRREVTLYKTRLGRSGEEVGKLTVTVHSGDIWADLKRHLLISAIILGVLLATLVGVTLFATRVVIGRPLERLHASIERLKTDGVSELVQWHSEDELGRVVDAYNEMQSKQTAAEAALRQHQVHLEERIDERTRELRNSEERLRDVMNSMADGLIVFNDETKCLMCNEQASHILRLPVGILKEGGSILPMVRHMAKRGDYGFGDLEELVNKRVAENKKLLSKAGNVAMEFSLANGTVIELRATQNGNGEQVGVYADITEQRAAERELRHAAEFQRELMDAIPINLVVVNRADSKLLYLNSTARARFGIERENVTSTDVEHIYYNPEQREAFLEVWRKHEVVDGMELVFKDSAGQPIPIVVHSKLITYEGKNAILSVSMDVSELKAVQAELRDAKDEAEAAAEAKSTFLATMSHEIRTPMNGVVGMIDILSQTKMEGDQKDMLATVRSSAFSLLGIIDDILDFSKMEAGKLQVEYIPVSIRDIVGDVAETLMVKATEKRLDLIAFVDPEIPAFVQGDQVRLRQILFNLAGNALKFTEKGRVIIRADRVDAATPGNVTVRYSVIDQGIGLSEEGLKKLFQPFSQAESSTTRRFGGTGLGLSICKTLTEIMGGKIGVESELGAGSTFTFTIPHDVADIEEEAEIKTDLKDVNVLVLMRDQDRREFVRRYLEHWQATVQTTEDVGAVAELARGGASDGKPFNVVVQGLAWSEPERAALRKSLQDDPQLSDIRFVVLRGNRSRAERAEIVDAVTVEGTPLRRESVLTAVAVAAGRVSPEVRYDEEIADLSRGEAPTVEVAELKGELILVAEDNLTNQNVILRQLGVLGYATDVVADGQQALQSLEKKNYAILLTDCHMPVMDGFQLAQTVRAAEDATGERLPIVAITASVLKGDVDKCLDAGMDDCLAKPLEMTKLKQMLAKWMPATTDASADIASTPLAENPQPSAASDKNQVPIDLTFLRNCFGDDAATHREILKDFVDSTPSYLEDIQTALNQKSAAEVASLAHAFKSAARTVGAHELADLCQSLEHAGKAEQWEKIKTLAPRLDPAMESVTHFVASF